MLLIEVGHIEIGCVSGKISDKYHFMSVLICGSSERLVIFHFVLVYFLSLVIYVFVFIFNS